MRIVHTSDWHAGRHWKGVNRLPELEAVLGSLALFVERERIDLLLVSGDVFDTGAPVAEAERLVFEFFKRMGRAGVDTIVIAGNHDSPARLEAWGTLAELVSVRAVARPRPPDRGGVIEIRRPSGEAAVIAMVPFAPTRGLVSALELAEDETTARQRYADGLRRIVEVLATRFRPDAVNLLVAHTHLQGAVMSGSERKVHLGEEWAATPQAIPPTAHYVALGHIHRPQLVGAAPAPSRYAGSPLQLDFGEAGEVKSFVFVEAAPGAPARVELVPYEGGLELREVRESLVELERRADELKRAGWIRVVVPSNAPDPNLNSRVRRLLPNAVSVDVELPEPEEPSIEVSTRGLAPRDLYRAYYSATHGSEPDEQLLAAFERLREQAERAGDET